MERLIRRADVVSTGLLRRALSCSPRNDSFCLRDCFAIRYAHGLAMTNFEAH